MQSVINYELPDALPDGVCAWRIDLEDSEGADLLAVLPAAVGWLERALRQKGTRTLVHCHAGEPWHGVAGGQLPGVAAGIVARSWLAECLTCSQNRMRCCWLPGSQRFRTLAGTSRSAAVVAAAIMKAKHMAAADALQLLRSKAPDVSPNDGFLAQLELFEQVAGRRGADAVRPGASRAPRTGMQGCMPLPVLFNTHGCARAG
jgi:hypothetical protein